MALSDKRILEEMRGGDIVISPFDRRNLATSSYDLTLGEWYFREQKPASSHHHIYNIYDAKHISRVWGKPLKAEPAKDVFAELKFDWKGIFPDDLIILLSPGETILAHTREFIGGRNHITTSMQARSSLGRSFIEVCKCAGWGDIGYVNRWTMEITNNSIHYSVPMVVGRRVAQMVFSDAGPIVGNDYTKSGKYSPSSDLETLKKIWKPEMMLPRLSTDWDAKPKKKK